jgi:hypothetical protein
MSKAFLAAFGAAVVVIGILIWTGFSTTAGNHLAPMGKIGKVRTVKASDDLTYMVIDFSLKNDSDRDMVVRTVEATIDGGDGSAVTGSPVAAADVDNAFQAYPLLGERYNEVLKVNDKAPAHQTVDRMVGLRLDAPYAQVEARKKVTLRIEDVTGPVVEMTK